MTEKDENKGEAGEKRDPVEKVGPGKPPKEHQFSKKNQPDPAKSAETRRKKRFAREVLQEMLNLHYTFPDGSLIKAQLVKAFGEKAVKNMTAGQIMAIQQMNKAILQGDTAAMLAVFNQAMGQPKQVAELQGVGGKDLFEQKSDAELKELLQQTLSKLNDQ